MQFQDIAADGDDTLLLEKIGDMLAHIHLPAAAASLIWESLSPSDRKAVFCSCKQLRQQFMPHVSGLTLTVPSVIHKGYSQLIHSLTNAITPEHGGLPCMHLSLVRQFFSMQFTSVGCLSGEGGPVSQPALCQLLDMLACHQQEAVVSCQSLAKASQQFTLQGFNLAGMQATTCLAKYFTNLQQLCFRNMDISGDFLRPFQLSNLANRLTSLSLSMVRLDADAVASFSNLSKFTSLHTFCLDRVLHPAAEAHHENNDKPASGGRQQPSSQHSTSDKPAGLPGLAYLQNLRNLQLNLHPRSPVQPSVQQLTQQLCGLSQLTSLKAWNMVTETGRPQCMDGACVKQLGEYCPNLAELEFDRNVSITGVEELLQLRALTSICARSLEPQFPSEASSQLPHENDEASQGYEDHFEDQFINNRGLVGKRCSWQRLSLGAFCPSLRALASLPLHSLTHPFCLNELDVGAHAEAVQGNMDAVAVAVRWALSNCVEHCKTLTFTAGKLELAGSAWGSPPLPDAAAALLALDSLRGRGVSHIKLVGIRVGQEEIAALSDALGDYITALTFCRCTVTHGALALMCDVHVLPKLQQLSFSRQCYGGGLQGLIDSLISRQGSAPPLHVRLVKPVGIESVMPHNIMASDADVCEIRRQLHEAGQERLTLELCNAIM